MKGLLSGVIQRVVDFTDGRDPWNVETARPEHGAAVAALLRGLRPLVADLGFTACRLSGKWLHDGRAGHWVRAWVALSANRIVGFAYAMDSVDSLVVEELFVHSAWRNQGIGEALLMAAEQHAEEASVRCLVCCGCDDELKRSWLDRLGYSCCARVGEEEPIVVDRPGFGSTHLLGRQVRILIAGGAE